MSDHHADKSINEEALVYHEKPVPGKLAIKLTKPAETQKDLSLAYTPGVAEPVRRIAENPDDAYRYTTKGNLVAVITDGSNVLGLGNVEFISFIQGSVRIFTCPFALKHNQEHIRITLNIKVECWVITL